MKMSLHPQGSDEWRRDRLGIPSASRFSDIITPKTLKRSSGKEYLYELVAELDSGMLTPQPDTWHMKWGKEHEARAVDMYAFMTGVDPEECGFCVHSSGIAGATPDRLVGNEGAMEAKCPALPKNHIKTMLSQQIPSDYRLQVAGGLWVTEREWWDYVSFHPNHPDKIAIIRVTREDMAAELKAISEILPVFHKELWSTLKALQS